MWKCGKCREDVEDGFGACWNCGTSADGVEDPSFPRAAVRPSVACSRCNVALEHLGTKRFHEGANWGVLGELGELFVKRERFDAYACPRCGRLEFFVDGVGEQYRPQ